MNNLYVFYWAIVRFVTPGHHVDCVQDFVAAGLMGGAMEDIMRLKYRKLLGNLGNALEALFGESLPSLREERRGEDPQGKKMLSDEIAEVSTPR